MPLKRFLAAVFVLVAVGLGPTGAQSPNEDRQAADDAFLTSRWADATPLYAKVLSKEPDDARSWFRYGYTLHSQEKFREAIAAYRHAIDLRYQRLVAQFNVACAYARLDQPDRAYKELEKAIDMGYNASQQLLQDVDLLSIRGTPQFDALTERTRNPVEHFAIGRQMAVPLGRWTGSGGTMTTNSSTRGFVRTIDMVGGQQRLFYVLLSFSATEGTWQVDGADRDGGVYKGAAEVSPDGLRLSGLADGSTPRRWSLTLAGPNTATVTIEDKAGDGWKRRSSYVLHLEADGGR